ncbi:MAG: tetratricopeptide repeat protein [Cyclobacteriaceae bacterium]
MNLKTPFLLSLLVLVATVAFGQDAEIKKSKRLIAVDHAAEAMAPIEAAIKQYPDEANLYYYLGYAQIKNNQLDAAAKSFDAGIAKDPKEAINYVGKGYLSMLQNRPADAKVNLDKALEMTKSKKVPVLKAVAEAYLTSAKFAGDAVALLLKAKGIKDDAEVETLLGDAYLLQNQAGSAVGAYENAAAMDPKNGEPYYKIGLIYSRPNPDESQKYLEKAVSVDPEFTYAYDELADIYYQRKEADKAVAAAEKFRQLSSDPEKIKIRLAFIYVMKGEFAKANEIFKDVIKKDNVKPIVYRYYTKSLLATKVSADSVESARVSEEFIAKAKPEDVTLKDLIDLGKLYLALKQDAKGVEKFNLAIQKDPKSVEAAQIHAETLFRGRQWKEAIAAYKVLMQIKTKPSPTDQLNLARCYSYTELYAQADTIYTKLIEQYPTNSAVVALGAGVKANLDPHSETWLAKPLYEKVIELATADPAKTSKKDLITAYKYMGSYYAIKEANMKKGEEYFDKVLALDPNDKQAKEVKQAIKEGQMQQLQQQKKSGR